MDRTSSAIVDYVAASHEAKLGSDASHAVRRTLVDCLACAVGGLDSRPAQVARALAAAASSDPGATAFGLARPTSVELAVFANTAMVRYLDWNDTYFTHRGGGGHPSDIVPTALAVGEAVGASGSAVMSAIACVTEGHAQTDADIQEFMSGNLCRCGAYPKIVEAIKQARGQMGKA